MEGRKIVVIVEEAEVSKTALKWALHNILRYGDILTLLHVFPNCPRNKKKLKMFRLKGYQLALSFKDICTSSAFNTKIEIVVTEDDAKGERIVKLVKEMGAFASVLGLHDHSFIYRLALSYSNIRKMFDCKLHAIKEPRLSSTTTTTRSYTYTPFETPPDLEFSQIELAPLQFPDHITPRKIKYQICPSPSAIIWRSKKTRRRPRFT